MSSCLCFVGQCLDVGCSLDLECDVVLAQLFVIAIFPWNHSTGPSGGNQVDSLPSAVRFEMLVAKIDFLLELKNRNICSDISFPNTLVYFSGPAGGRSLRARAPLMVGT